MDSQQSRFKKLFNADVGIFTLAVVFIGAMHSIAFEDRFHRVSGHPLPPRLLRKENVFRVEVQRETAVD